jgi:hypothetical protein
VLAVGRERKLYSQRMVLSIHFLSSRRRQMMKFFNLQLRELMTTL